MTVSRDHYYRLSSDLESERIGAAVALINELTEANEEAEWQYALTRLIKGLSSSRGSARLGFSTCLAEIINIRLSDGLLTITSLIELINENTKISSSMNGKEERAVLFGKLFGLQALSNFVSQLGISKNITDGDFKLFVDHLIELSCLKSWIREPSLFTIFNIIKSHFDTIPQDSIVYIFEKLDESKLSLSTEGLSLYLAVPVSFRADVLSKLTFQNKTWSKSDPLNRSNLQLLAKVLKDISTGDDSDNDDKGQKLKKKGTWSPRLHFVWPLIVEELTSSTGDEHTFDEEAESNSKKRKKSSEKKHKKQKTNDRTVNSDQISVSEFWKVIIDESFFNEKASHERKYWGFEVFELLYQSIQSQDTEILFSQNFLRTLINQSSDNSRLLNKVAKKTLSKMTDIASKQSSKVIPTLSQLVVGPYGSLQFDRLTKTKTVELLVNSSEVSNKELSDFFIKILNNPVLPKESDSLKVQKWAIDQLLHLVRSKKSVLTSSGDFEWVDSILRSLIRLAYFKNPQFKAGKKSASESKEGEADDAEEQADPIVEFTQERLNSILSDVISITRTDNQTWSHKTLTSLLDYIEKGETPLFEFDEELNAVKEKSLKTLKKIRSLRESTKHLDSSRLLVFELLFSMLILQLFAGDSESVSTLQELQEYYQDSKKNSRQSDGGENQQESVIGIVEILLNFISQKSSLLKKLSMIVWENFCDQVDLNGLELLFDIITTKENKEGQKALFEGEDEFVDEDEESGSEDDHDHDHSHSHADSDEDEEEEESESEEESEDEDEEDGDVDEVEKKTNVALAEALKIPYNGEVVLSSDDEDDFSDESMDDEQMMEIDDQLSRIFKQRRDALDTVKTGNKRKAEVEEARSNILLFKHRVVDFIEAFVKKNPQSELIIHTISPLLTGLKLTLDKTLGVKIHKLLKNRICKSKILIKTIEKDELLSLLETIQKDLLRSSNTNDFNLSSSQCSIFISKQILQLDDSSVDEIIDIYTKLLKNWWKKKNSKLTSSIFFDFINWLNSKRSNQESSK